WNRSQRRRRTTGQTAENTSEQQPARARCFRASMPLFASLSRFTNIGAPGFEPGTSPTRTVRATRLRYAPSVNRVQAGTAWRVLPGDYRRGKKRARSGGDGLVIADREARHQRLEAFLDAESVQACVVTQPPLFDRCAFLYDLVD